MLEHKKYKTTKDERICAKRKREEERKRQRKAAYNHKTGEAYNILGKQE